MQSDPRTVARDIPGFFEELFPQLTSGIVAHFNAQAVPIRSERILPEAIRSTRLRPAMLFELGYAVGEALLEHGAIDWESCFRVALRRQREFYDARTPDALMDGDRAVAEIVGRNLVAYLTELSVDLQQPIVFRPLVPGLEWIATGRGDFAVGDSLVEVKCSNHTFAMADYRQVAIYWLLSYAASVEQRGSEWRSVVLLNPRLGFRVSLGFDSFLAVVSSGRTKIDMLQLFVSLVGSRLTR